MVNLFNEDFQDLIGSFNKHDVQYILVGGYSVIIHGYHRATGDMDLWVKPTKDNYQKMISAFSDFGLPIGAITEKMFLSVDEFDVFQFGITPSSIDIMTSVKGLDFAAAFARSAWHNVSGQTKIRVLHLQDLINAKRAAGRYKDLADIEELNSIHDDAE